MVAWRTVSAFEALRARPRPNHESRSRHVQRRSIRRFSRATRRSRNSSEEERDSRDAAYRIGRAFVQVLGRKDICIGRDMRESGVAILEALARGATDGGADVTQIGLISTDALYFAVGKYGFDGGIMITASHNPAAYNGFKFCREEAQAISLDTGLSSVRDVALKEDFTTPARKGTIKDRAVLEAFGLHCVSFVRDVSKIKPFKIAIDAGNGMAGETIKHVFKHLPCEVVPLFFELDGTFPNHPASPIEDENKLDLRKAVIEQKCDLGVAFDGDADRMFLVDEAGGFPDGSIVTAAVGAMTLKKHPGSKILYNLICSRSVRETVEKNGGVAVRSPVGHSLIKPIMRDQDIAFGGEHSGHFYFRDNWFADSGMIALMQCLDLFSEIGTSIKTAIATFDTRFRSGEINTKVADADAKMREIEAFFKGARVDRLDGITLEYPDFWLNVRKSNTEPLLRLNVEGDTQKLMEEHRDEALQVIRSA